MRQVIVKDNTYSNYGTCSPACFLAVPKPDPARKKMDKCDPCHDNKVPEGIAGYLGEVPICIKISYKNISPQQSPAITV